MKKPKPSAPQHPAEKQNKVPQGPKREREPKAPVPDRGVAPGITG